MKPSSGEKTASDSFLWQPAHPGGLAALRIGVASVLLLKALCELPAYERIYGGAPLIPWALSELRLLPGAPRTSEIGDWLQRYGISHEAFAHGLWVLYIGGLLLLLPGILTRGAAIAAWIGHLILHNGGSLASYGVDFFADIGLFYCAVFPVGSAASVDRILRKAGPAVPTITANTCLLVLRGHLSLAYLSSGFSKATGEQWWSGEAIWRAVMQPQFAQFDMSWLARFPWVAQVIALSTIAIEIGYPFFVWPRATRKLWLALVVGMHLGIGLTMGLWFFSGIMIALDVAALYDFGNSNP